MATAAKLVLPIPIFFGLSRSSRCGCDRKHYCKALWSLEWIKKKMHLGFHGNGRHFEFFQPLKSCHTLRWIFLQNFMKFDEWNQFFFKSPFFCFDGNCGKVCPTDSDFFGLLMWMLFLSSFINFCSASNLLWSLLCFSIFLHFCRFHGNDSHFEKQSLWAELHIAYDIPTRFHKVWSRHLREMERKKMCGRIIVKKKRRIAVPHPTGVGVT